MDFSAMTEFWKIWGPGLLMLFVNLIYLSYRFGRIEEKIISSDQRIGRLEAIQDNQAGD